MPWSFYVLIARIYGDICIFRILTLSPFGQKKTGKNLEEGIREKEKEEKMVKERKERGRKHH